MTSAHGSVLSGTRLRGQLSASGGTDWSPASIRKMLGVLSAPWMEFGARSGEGLPHEGRTNEDGIGCSQARHLFAHGAFYLLANSNRALNAQRLSRWSCGLIAPWPRRDPFVM